MSDLINRQDAIDALWQLQRGLQMIDASEGADITIHGVQLALRKIEDLLTIDAVEVVRCMDCIHNQEHKTSFGSKFHICNLNKLAFTQYADFYCAYGERRKE